MFWIYNRKKILSVHLKLLSIHRDSSVARLFVDMSSALYLVLLWCCLVSVLFFISFLIYFILFYFLGGDLEKKYPAKF